MPSRSCSRDSMASDQGAWTRPPKGVSKRQPPIAQLVAEPLDHDPPIGGECPGRVTLVLEIGDQVLGRPLVEVVVIAQALCGVPPALRAASQIGLHLADERADGPPELDRPAQGVALPERELARNTGRRADGDPVVPDLQHAPAAGAKDDDVAVHPGPQLVDHLLVELADAPARRAGLALDEDPEQAAVRDRAAARDGDHAGVAAALDGVGDAVPDEPRLELGEFVAGVGAGEHAEDAIEDVAGQRLVRRRPRRWSGTARRRSNGPSRSSRRSAGRGRRAGCAGSSWPRSRPRACASSRRPPRAGRLGTSGRSRPCWAPRPGGPPDRPVAGRGRRSSGSRPGSRGRPRPCRCRAPGSTSRPARGADRP